MADVNTKVNLELQVVLRNTARHGQINFCN